MTSKKFIKKKENFVCENCNFKNIGNGYTNHCSECFFSKHVDINVGDRLNNCKSLMKVVDYYYSKNNYIIVHECLKCKKRKNDKVREGLDNFSNFLKIIEKVNQKKIN